MLVLSRKVGEAVAIGDDVVVKIAEVRGNRVRLAFEAPRDVAIDRSEVRERQSPEPEIAA